MLIRITDSESNCIRPPHRMNVPQSPETILEIRLQEICNFAGDRVTLQHSRMELAEPRITLLAQPGKTLVNDLITELFVTSHHPCSH
jgi:hypothetical protein